MVARVSAEEDRHLLQGVAVDREEYIEGIVALAVPLDTGRGDFQAAVWAVGLRRLPRR